jgi:hypothetical protein
MDKYEKEARATLEKGFCGAECGYCSEQVKHVANALRKAASEARWETWAEAAKKAPLWCGYCQGVPRMGCACTHVAQECLYRSRSTTEAGA